MRLLRVFAMAAAASFLVPDSLASELGDLARTFARTWDSGYVAGQCGKNIKQLLTTGYQQGLTLPGAKILTLTNAGSSVFGLVNAERARMEHPRRKVTEKNWYHHVVLVFDRHVFDFDFMTEPTVLPVHDYFERMFLDEIDPPELTFYKVGRDRKLDSYRIRIHDGRGHVTGSGGDEGELTLREFLERH